MARISARGGGGGVCRHSRIREDGVVALRKGVPLDVAFGDAVLSQLPEWASAEDVEAYGDL
jgi:hypothetical protein